MWNGLLISPSLVVVILLSIVLVKHDLHKDAREDVASTDQIVRGTGITLPDVDWAKSCQTLLLILSQGATLSLI